MLSLYNQPESQKMTSRVVRVWLICGLKTESEIYQDPVSALCVRIFNYLRRS